MAASGHNLQGKRLYQQGQYPAAAQRFQKALAADPTNADAYYNLASAFHRMGTANSDQSMLTQSETLYNQCLDLDEDHADCHRGLAVLLVETGREDRALALLKNWVVANPQLADARIELARLHHEFGDRETARMQLEQAIQLDQQNARAWNALAKIREEQGDYRQALNNYQQSYQLNNFQPLVATRIAELQRAVGGGMDATTGGGTRTVNSNSPSLRY